MGDMHFWFFFGLFSTLILKPKGLGNYFVVQIRQGVSFRHMLLDYFFGDTAAGWTTIITFLVGWLGVAIYLGDIAEVADLATIAWVGQLPHHPAIAAILGVAFEYAAPKFVNWVVRKIGGE